MADEGTGASGQPEDLAFAALRTGGQSVRLGPSVHRGLQAGLGRCGHAQQDVEHHVERTGGAGQFR